MVVGAILCGGIPPADEKGGAVERILMCAATRKGVIEETILKRMKKEKDR